MSSVLRQVEGPASVAENIVALARQRARQQADTVAYTFLVDGEAEERHFTYAALDRRARTIAAALQQRAAPGDRILLLYEPGLEYVAAFFGCLYAGMVAVPAFPPEPLRLNRTLPRLQAMIADAQAALVLGSSAGLAWFEPLLADLAGNLRLLATDELSVSPGDWTPVAVSAEDLAYLQYTSGSTGAPRGVMIDHSNLWHNVAQIERGQGSRTVGVTWLPMYHDFGLVAAVLLPMYSGSRTISMSPLAFVQRPWRWLAAVTRYRGTIIGGPNFAYDLCVRKISPDERRQLDLSSLAIVLNGAEAVRHETLERFVEAFGPFGFRREAFVPCYGLAEATLGVTGGASLAGGPVVERFEISALSRHRAVVGINGRPTRALVSSGRCLARTEVLIVDPDSHSERSARQIGEIWVRSPGVASGYWNRPQETEQAFRAYLPDGRGPYLRTGDLGFLHAGELFVTGRLKDQIIICGRNLYAQDIEDTVGRAHALLKSDAGAAFSIDAEGQERLVVVQELKRTPKNTNLEEVFAAIRQAVLSEHDVPPFAIALIRSGSLPRTTSHKVQRRACRQLFLEEQLEPLYQWRAETHHSALDGAGQPAAPRTETEARLLELWREVLQNDTRGIHDNFFEHGGQSLLATQLVARVRRQWQIDLPLAALFRSPTIASLAAEIDAAPREQCSRATTPLATSNCPSQAPLSFAQQRLYFMDELAPESSLNHLSVAVRVAGPLDGDAMWRSLLAITDRHQSLRTTFARTENGPVQMIHPWQLPTLAEIDLRDSPPEDRQRIAGEHIDAEARRMFDLAQGPLWRVIWLQLADDDHRLLLAMHHIIADGWSMGVLLSELWQVYQAQLLDLPPPLPPLPLQYLDYVTWQRSAEAIAQTEAQLVYWRRQLVDDPPPLELPTDRPRPAAQTYRGATHPIELSTELTSQIEALARDSGATPFVVLLASLQALLHRYTGQTDFCLGAAAANRARPEFEPLVGFFVNMLPLRADLSDDPSFEQLLQRAKQTALTAFDQQEVPFERLVEEFAATRDASRSPLFQVALVVQNTPLPSVPGVAFDEIHTGAAKYDLTFALADRGGRLAGTLEYSTDLFDADTIDRIIANWSALLAAAVAKPAQCVSRLPVMPESERQRLLMDWSSTRWPVNCRAQVADVAQSRLSLRESGATCAERKATMPCCLHELFERQAAQTPDAIAVVFEGRKLSYRELNKRANRLAWHLRRNRKSKIENPKSDVLVAICLERSLDTVVAILGALKSGAAYVPLDPALPAERLQEMLADASPTLVLTQRPLAERLGDFSGPIVCLDEADDQLALQGCENLPPITDAERLAYVIYTSGSTGKPKGVMVSHAAVVAVMQSAGPLYDFGPGDIWTLFHSYAFDFSVWELWGALAFGGRLVVVPRAIARSADSFHQLLIDEQVTVLNQTPAAFNQLMQSDERAGAGAERLALRLVILAGEMLDVAALSGWFDRHGDAKPLLVNMYGITETAIVSTWRPLTCADLLRPAASPIGRPLPGCRVFVLDGQRQPVPIGVPGELYLGGMGLARGYLNRPDLTAERFIASPFEQSRLSLRESTRERDVNGDHRLYRSGDRVRWRANGELEYLGRLDQQVKIRGFRIELGEIETHLARHPHVREAAVVARENGPGGKRLVAYIVPRHGEQNGHAELRDWLKARLPEYMLPAAFVTLDALPLTPHGKLDRRALPQPTGAAVALHAYVAPRSSTEAALADLWAELLGVERVGIDDNFFDLGGHSLLAMQLMTRLRERFRAEIPLRRLFEEPTIARLARAIDSDSPALDCDSRTNDPTWAWPIPIADRQDEMPLSFAQERLFFLEQLEPDSPCYHIPLAVELTGLLNIDALRASLKRLVARHESLRTRFFQRDGRPVHTIADAVELPLPIVDLAHLAPPEQSDEVERLAQAAARQRFDLGAAPVARAQLVRLADERHVFVLVLHHLVADGWSLGLLLRELLDGYKAHAAGRDLPAPALTVQYADYAVWQRGAGASEARQKNLDFWTKALDGVPQWLELPTDRPRPPLPSGQGGQWTTVIPRRLVDRLEQLSRKHDATLYMTLLAAFETLLGRLSGQDRFCLGTPVAGRLRRELESLIGLFVNTLVLPIDLRDHAVGTETPVGETANTGLTFEALLRRVKETTLAAFAHQELPVEYLVKHLQPERHTQRTPLFQVMFALQNTPWPAFDEPGMSIRPLEITTGAAKVDLTLSLRETMDGLQASWEYSSDLLDRETVIRWAGHFQTMLEAIADDPTTSIARLPLLTADQSRQMLIDWNKTACDYPREQCAHELFAERAARRPEAIALLFGNQSLTYGELNRRANQLAHYLRSLGVGAETRVGLLLERSIELIVALLAVSKAGGCYVPLDLDNPAQRLADIIADADPALILSNNSESRIQNTKSLDLSLAADEIALQPSDDPQPLAGAENLAYFMYTSGSTGRPKGIAVPHRAIVRLVWPMNYCPIDDHDVFLHASPSSFDASTFEIWGALARGATLAIAPPGTPEIGKLIDNHRVTVLWLTAALFHALVDEDLESLAGVRRLLAGGDVLSPSRVRRFVERFPECTLINGYGPTEGTTFSCCHTVGLDDPLDGSVPIGRPIDNTQAYVLDENLQPAPVGVPGELYLGGDGLAREYWKLPELTAERFITVKARLYKTGDRARWRADGLLEFLGRLDQQVKLRGFRIEPAEIESQLLRHPQICQAAVVACPDASGGNRLIAFIVPGSSIEGNSPAGAMGSLDIPALRSWLEDVLPGYMIPASFIELATLPLSPHGKLDRSALAARVGDVSTQFARLGEPLADSHRSPRTETEAALTAIWQELLGVEHVGIDDNFFDLGGHSLLAMRVTARVRDQFQIDLPLRRLFETPTIASLAAWLEAGAEQQLGAASGPIAGAAHDSPWPLSFAQERLYFLNQLAPASPMYNIAAAAMLDGSLDAHALQAALQQLIDRHEILRTRFEQRAHGLVQEAIAPLTIDLPVSDLRDLPDEAQTAELERLAGVEARRPFDLAAPPLLRARLLRMNERRHALVLVLHHIVADGWSLGILVGELAALYQARCRGGTAELAPLSVRYADYAVWQRQALDGGALESDLEFWEAALRDMPRALELPADRPRPAAASGRGGEVVSTLPATLVNDLRRLARRGEATLYMTLLAGFELLLGRLSGQERFCLGTPVAGRTRPELEHLIGLFVNTLVLPVDLADGGTSTFETLLERVKQTTLAAFAHQQLPLEKLVDRLQPKRELDRGPLFQVMFALQNSPLPERTFAELSLRPVHVASGAAPFDLTLSLRETGESIEALWQYNSDLFDRETMVRWANHFQTLLTSIVNRPGAPIDEIELLSRDELRQIALAGNDTTRLYPADFVHGQFAEQAARRPDAAALVYGEQLLTYGELNRRANQLAHYLQSRGVGPETCVAIALERSMEMIVAVLGVLKAGGAYLPLDLNYPDERLRFMLDDARPAFVLCHNRKSEIQSLESARWLGQSLGDAPAEMATGACSPIDFGSISAELAQQSTDNPALRAAEHHLAYVIYTSGSTGIPKGVAVEHGSWANLAHAQRDLFLQTTDDRVLQFAPLSFDASVWEISLALASGAALVLSSPEALLPGEPLVQLLRDRRVTIATLPPSILAALPPAELPDLRLIISAGEACRAELVRQWGQGRRFVNAYGPTETTVCATAADCPANEPRPPIGRPLPNVRVDVLDARGRPVPIGVPGELYVGGAGVARGYLNQPELTAERFIDHRLSLRESTHLPGVGVGEARFYRTGDVVRWRPDGQLEFLGRADQQVKIRGFRIEPGEIEAVLRRHPAVREAAVVTREEQPGQPRLFAYVVSAGDNVSVAGLREYLRSQLPGYMAPASLILLDELPLSAHGKLDRAALPAPARHGGGSSDGPREPVSETEQALVEIWRQVLGLEQVGIDDNFFELGGDSIQTLAVVSHARQRGIFFTPRQLFEQPTIAGLAAVASASSAIDAEQGIVMGDVPLTPIQRWFFDTVGWASPTTAPFGETDESVSSAHPTILSQEVLVEVTDTIDASLLEQALTVLVLHHDALRLRLYRAGDGWRQVNAGVEVLSTAFWLEQADQRGLSAAAAEADTQRLLARLRARFDFESGPLVAAAIITTDGASRLLLTIHHLVVDTVSWRIILEDLLTAYRQLAAREPVRLPPKTTSLRQWALRLADYARQNNFAAHQAYWHDLLAAPAGRLRCDFAEGFHEHASATFERTLSSDETAALGELASLYRMPTQDLVLAIVGHALRPLTGDDLMIDIEHHGRDSGRFEAVDLSRTVGWFTSLYPVRLDFAGAASPGESLLRVKPSLRESSARGFEYGVLRYLSHGDTKVPRSPAEICFNYLGQHRQMGQPAALHSRGNDLAQVLTIAADRDQDGQDAAAPRPYLIEVTAEIRNGRLMLRWTYRRNRLRDVALERVAARFVATVRELMSGQPDARVQATPGDFPLARLDDAALARLVGEGRDIEDIYPLSPLQMGMLYHSLAEQPLAAEAASEVHGGGAYIEQLSCRLSGPLDVAAFRQAWRTVIERHTALRTALEWGGLREPLAIVQRHVELPWQDDDWSKYSEREQAARLETLLHDDRRRGFDLAIAPLLRLKLIRLSADEWRLVWTHHHLLLDGWSLPLLLNELMLAYECHAHGQRSLPLPPSRPYRDFIAWLARQDVSRAERYWRDLLRGVTEPTRLCFEAGESTQTRSASEAEMRRASLARRVGAGGATAAADIAPGSAEAHFAIHRHTTRAAAAFARRHQITLNTLLQGAWALVLARHAGSDDVVYGTTMAGRPGTLAGADSMVGLFINTLPVRARLPRESFVVDWLRSLQGQLAETRHHEQTPLASIRRWSELPPGVPLFESLWVFENYPIDAALRSAHAALRPATERAPANREATLGHLRLSEIESRSQTNFPLNVVVSAGDEIALRINYDARRFELADIERLAADYQETLACILNSGQRRLSELPCLCSEQNPWHSVEGGSTSRVSAQDATESVPHRSPSTDLTKSSRSACHRAPRTETERLLADLWRDVLRLDRVGVEDDFFELGGDSIQAVRVMSLAAAQGRIFPPQMLFERPTIAALAAAIDGTIPAGNRADGAPGIVPIRTGGTRIPLVGIHPVGGMVFPYYALARHLGADQSFYAIQSRGLSGGDPHQQIEAMAADYLDQLRTALPTGRFQLAGWSFGGIVAYEMARQIAATGERQPRLILIDSGIDSVGGAAPDAGMAALLGLYGAADRRSLAELESLSDDERLRYFTAQISAAGLAPAHLPDADARRLLSVFEANARAGLAYRPRPAPVQAVLLRSEEHTERNGRDPSLGWKSLLEGGLEIESLPGNHLTLLREPHVRALAERLERIVS
ncbi:MAG TPA: non-ribosomal peptide synthase/polyketide synthase [Pirellulales bacterium]